LSAVAHQLGDEPIDLAEAAMPAAAFEIIQRAHAICDHPPAVDLTVDLEQSAEQALNEARAILRDLDAETEPTDDVKPLVPDRKQAAADAWAGESWAQAAKEYQVKRGRRRTIVESEPQKLRRLRALLDDDVSLQRAYAEISSSHIKGRAFRRRGCAQ
jgi:hypothetical protein